MMFRKNAIIRCPGCRKLVQTEIFRSGDDVLEIIVAHEESAGVKCSGSGQSFWL